MLWSLGHFIVLEMRRITMCFYLEIEFICIGGFFSADLIDFLN